MSDLNSLKDRYKDSKKHALLLATGPSLNLYKDFFQNIPEDYVVFCIKSAIDILPHGRCDFHLLNNMKLKKYKYKVKRPFVVYASVGKKEKDYVQSNLKIRLKPPSISRSHNYSTLLEFNYIKKSGPGIMYDLALPYIYFLGFTSVYICGWDLFPIGTPSNVHFDGKYGHKKTRTPCFYNGKMYNESDIINIMSEPIYNECIKNNFQIYILAHDGCHLSPKIPRVFCPCFYFDPYNYLVLNYQNINHTLYDAWNHKKDKNNNFVNDYTDIFFLQYICSYHDLNTIVINNLKQLNLSDHNEIKCRIIDMARYHYNDIGKHEILSYKRQINIFDPWCYIASYFEHKYDYWHNDTLDFIKALYTWITVGFPNNLEITIKSNDIAKNLLKIGK